MILHDEAVCRGAQQKPAELAQLQELLEGDRIDAVLEIGSWRGGMLWWLRQAFAPRLLVSVDIYPQPEAHVSIVGWSHAPDTVAQAAEHAPFDLVFIDAGHTYADVSRDYELYGPLGRIVCLHDIVEHEPDLECDVHTLWRKIEGDKRELLAGDGEPWGGIGVVYR